MVIPVRTFSANSGDKSTGNAGADALETDIDAILNVFNPSGTSGGIIHSNLRNGALPATSSGRAKMANGFITADHLTTGLIGIGTTMSVHRNLSPIDHPAESVTTGKLATAVTKSILSRALMFS